MATGLSTGARGECYRVAEMVAPMFDSNGWIYGQGGNHVPDAAEISSKLEWCAEALTEPRFADRAADGLISSARCGRVRATRGGNRIYLSLDLGDIEIVDTQPDRD